MHKVFVYGTLKQGQANHHLLLGCYMIGFSTTEPSYTMFNVGHFPAVIDKGITAINGEVYDVSDDVLKQLDRLEGHPNFYERKKIRTEHGEAWIYLMPIERLNGGKEISSGNWTSSKKLV